MSDVAGARRGVGPSGPRGIGQSGPRAGGLSGPRGSGPGRLDPTVRALLRAFLSPAVADRYASALQPIAVADRDAAIAGAVSTLRARFFVLPEELAVALVEDTGWSVADVSTLLGIPTLQIRNALRETAAAPQPRVGAVPPTDLEELGDEAALVEELLADLPQHRRDAAGVLAEPDTTERVDVELSTTLPAYVGLPALEARMRRSDRIQRIVVNASAVAILGLVALTLDATRPVDPDLALPDEEIVAVEPVTRPTDDTAVGPAVPEDDRAQVPVGPVEIDDLRFVATVDPATGEPGPALTEAEVGQDPRLWLRLTQMPARDVVLQIRFTAPNGRASVRPVLLRDRTPLVSVRLPDELGRAPGRYAATVEADDLAPQTIEIELTATA